MCAFDASFFVTVILVINTILSRKLVNYINMFLFVWIVILTFSGINLYNYYPIQEKTYVVILVGCIGIVLGGLIRRIVRHNRKSRLEIDGNKFAKAVHVILIIHIATTIYFTLRSISILGSGIDYSYLRNIYQGYDKNVSFINGFFDNAIRNWIALPLETCIIVLISAVYIKRIKIKHFYKLALFDQVLYTFYTQGRSALFYIAIFIFVMVAKNWRNLSRTVRRRAIRIFILAMIIIVALFNLRNSELTNSTVLSLFYKYVCGCVSLLDQKIIISDNQIIRTYGLNSLYGILTPIESLLNVLHIGRSHYYDYLTAIQLDKENFILIGNNIWMNAYCTIFYDFYLDFGLWGVFLGQIVFGTICQSGDYVFNDDSANQNALSISYSLLVLYAVFMSIVRWELVSSTYVLCMFYMIIISIYCKYNKRKYY